MSSTVIPFGDPKAQKNAGLLPLPMMSKPKAIFLSLSVLAKTTLLSAKPN